MRVLKLLRHLLCLGLLFGLAGNGVAVAAPCILMSQAQPAAMADMTDCDMARPAPANHQDNKGKAPGCMAMTACTAVLAMKEPAAPAAGLRPAATPAFWSTATILTGRDVAPEAEPPTLLG